MWHVNYSPIDHFETVYTVVWITPYSVHVFVSIQTMWLLIAFFFFIIICFSVVIMRTHTFRGFQRYHVVHQLRGPPQSKKEKSVIVLLPFIEYECKTTIVSLIFITTKQSKTKSVYKLHGVLINWVWRMY